MPRKPLVELSETKHILCSVTVAAANLGVTQRALQDWINNHDFPIEKSRVDFKDLIAARNDTLQTGKTAMSDSARKLKAEADYKSEKAKQEEKNRSILGDIKDIKKFFETAIKYKNQIEKVRDLYKALFTIGETCKEINRQRNILLQSTDNVQKMFNLRELSEQAILNLPEIINQTAQQVEEYSNQRIKQIENYDFSEIFERYLKN